jgi:hypothetical protein
MKRCVVLVAALGLGGCGSKKEPPPATGGGGSGSAVASGSGSAAPVAAATRNAVPRADFNRLAVRLNLPIYWIADTNKDANVDADEVAQLLFYPTPSADLDAAYQAILAAKDAPLPEDERRRLVIDDLDQGRPTLVLTQAGADDAFLTKMLAVAAKIDELYATQTGAAALREQVPADVESQSLFRRNGGPACVAPRTEGNKACSAIPGAPKAIVDVYPAAIDGVAQTDPKFCATLQARKDAKDLTGPFTVVREVDGKLKAIPLTEAYTAPMAAVADELTAAAALLTDPADASLVAYLKAAAAAFKSNDWFAADEAWAKMSADNSRWYVRVGPDEMYWEPCSLKSGFHLTLARINPGSKVWQGKLVPIQQELEGLIAKHAGAPYKARDVKFHMPDFIDIVINAGDDRSPLSATVGQSLPNFGPVKDESRGRTVVMANLYTDVDSAATSRANAESVLDKASMATYSDDAEPVGTILHEATHNFGPQGAYQVKGKTSEQVFGGPIASMLEELKAQTGAWFLIEVLRGKGALTDEQAAHAYAENLVWSFGQISRGMYTPDGTPKAYSQLAAIHVGFMLDKGALSWDPKAAAANGTDTGAFTVHTDKLVAVADEMMTVVGGIMARGDKPGIDALIKKYVDGEVVPIKVIEERFARAPRVSFVYSIKK